MSTLNCSSSPARTRVPSVTSLTSPSRFRAAFSSVIPLIPRGSPPAPISRSPAPGSAIIATAIAATPPATRAASGVRQRSNQGVPTRISGSSGTNSARSAISASTSS